MTKSRITLPDDVDETSDESFPASDPPAWTGVTGSHAAMEPRTVAPPLEIVNNEKERRFEARTVDGIAELQYRHRGHDALVLVHTEVPAALAGRGIAGALARHALSFARAQGLKVVPRCPFVAAFIERHPEYADLVEH